MELPNLQLIPIEYLIPHEHFDPQRTLPLYKRMRTSKLFRHPAIVMPLGPSRYIILDGANRAAVLREMGMQHILVQVVRPDDPGLKILSWNHVLSDLEPADLLRSLEEVPGLHLEPIRLDMVEAAPQSGQNLAAVLVRQAGAYRLETRAESLSERVRLLNAIVNSYKNFARMDRTTVASLEPLQDLYPSLTGLVVFPPFQINEISQMVENGYQLPPGVTRTTISPRALHVNFPLENLAAASSLKYKNLTLERFLHERMAGKKVRHYAEATFFFDE